MPMYFVPTPIGNLADMTFRAVDILQNVDLILAEDTRTSSFLLNHYQIKTPLKSFHLHNEHQMLTWVLEKLKNNEKIALVSDAGTPGISDPGYILAKLCKDNDIPLETLPGATAFVPALINSALPNHEFSFYGFLPPKKGRQTLFSKLILEDKTMIFYESPHKLLKTLNDFLLTFGEQREISVSRELTKKFEENLKLPLVDMLAHFTKHSPRGEFVLILEGKENFEKRLKKLTNED